jgi:hypothetical protein
LDLIDSQLRSVEIIFFTTLFLGLLPGWAGLIGDRTVLIYEILMR